MGPAFSRLLYRLMGGRDSQTLSWAIGTYKDTNRLAQGLYGLWPSHFDASINEEAMKYEPGPLTESDKKDLRSFQTENNLQVDGIYGHETHGTWWGYMHTIMDALETADAKVMELTARLAECCLPDDPGPIYPVPENMGAMKVVILLLIGAFAGFLGAQVF